ncbi:hypothetical protein [Lactiplantibacillus carotarum]|uniref:hypothetical protein n=1 Tax=Lactiplantibacillus carotarum TaxID=2993456 RepID=UPI00298F0E38|nr:hypothetical protein [Lactiplantibacillus carotarum]
MDNQATNTGFTHATDSVLADADAQLFENVKKITKETYQHYHNLGEARAGGYSVEQVHAELYNWTQKLNGNKTFANAIDDNKLADIISENHEYQLKFLKNSNETYKEITQTFGDHFKKTNPSGSFEEWKLSIGQITSLIRTSPESFNGSLLMMYF